MPGSGANWLAGATEAGAVGIGPALAENSFNAWSRCIIAVTTEPETPMSLR
jgi:hypothetical protein